MEKNINSKNSNIANGKKVKVYELRYFAVVLLTIFDILAVTLSYFAALWFRFDCHFTEIPAHFLSAWLYYAPINAMITVGVLWCFKLYQSVWKYASYKELERIAISSFILAIVNGVAITFIFEQMPITYYVIGFALQFCCTLTVRFAYRFIRLERNKVNRLHSTASRVMLIGGGSAGEMLLRDLHNSKNVDFVVCCIIDDNRSKWGKFLDGVPIVGGRDDILLNVEKYKIEKIFIAIPSASLEERRDILDICKETGCELKNVPSVAQYINGTVTVNSMKPVDVVDLLGRDPITVNMEEIYSFITGKVILVTGGGGSIGSELCRQIAKHNPKKLIVFDIYENNAHNIGLELKDNNPNLDLEVLIGSVRDSKRLNQVFAKYKPDVVYHAAAHKHVPLMEDSPCESIKNNAIGTYKTAYSAMINGCKRFVLISTDKAVNPTNIMGASKRLCEMIIQSFDKKIRDGKICDLKPLHLHEEDLYDNCFEEKALNGEIKTEFVAVRFGNVLGSNGSVIPRFKEQIAKGGPVTVTHPDIIRYFMTIPEAASLVLQAGTYANGGEIFILDMGSPVKIDTLARNLIRLSGLKPDVDIKISYTGLRAGEKLYEEKLMSEEGLKTTPNKLIHIGSPIPFDENEFLNQLQGLMHVAYNGQDEDIRNLVAEIVPTYHPAGEHGSEEKGDAYKEQIKTVKE